MASFRQCQKWAALKQPMQTSKENPFLGLKPYELADRKKLYGRDKDLFLMKDRIFSSRTTLLFAGSGVGKTSFINAKIIPELKGQYHIVYHNQWAIGDPLPALINSIRANPLSPQSPASLPTPGIQNVLVGQLGEFMRPEPSDGESTTRCNRCLIILDQFEEVFQHHSHEGYFARFIEELAELINFSDCNSRVLFSMREEFLGELSVFDNKTPDLFNNYYRLKCPNKQEAEEIIELTCNIVNVSTNGEKLKVLVRDLARVDKEKTVSSGGSVAGDGSLVRDIVPPPYLQIACQSLWDQQFRTNNGSPVEDTNGLDQDHFLANYQTGQARQMLRLYCRQKLASLNQSERALLAGAFDYLVTKQGAKMAYELSTLAEHMQVKVAVLKSVLVKLSIPESRILRQTNGPGGALWFELYHDMYGPIVDEWKRSYQLEEKAKIRRIFKTAAALVVVFALIAAVVWSFDYWWKKPRQYEKTLLAANLQDPKSFGEGKLAFENLRDTWGFENRAKRLWAETWGRRAKLAEKQERSQEALLSWLTAAAEGPPGQEGTFLAQAEPYLGVDGFGSLLGSFQLKSDASVPGSAPLFSADGKTLLSLTTDMKVSQWDTRTSELIREPSLELDDPDPSGRPGPSSPGPSRPPEASGPPGATSGPTRNQRTPQTPEQGYSSEIRIQAAGGNLIGGVSGNLRGPRFFIWRADNGKKFWKSGPNKPTPGPQNAGAGYGSSYGFQGAAISITTDGRYFATLDQQGSAQLYNVIGEKVETGEQISSVAKVAFSPDNHTLLVFFNNRSVQIRNLDAPSKVRTVKELLTPVPGVTFSPDGSKFLAMSQSDTSEVWEPEVGIWDTEKGERVSGISGEVSSDLAKLSFCADNQTVAVSDVDVRSSENKKALITRFWNSDAKGVSAIRTMLLESLGAYDVNPDGTSILFMADGNVARLWRLSPSGLGKKVIQDTSPIQYYSTSSNGQVVTTINQERRVINWDTASLTQMGQPFTVHKSEPQGDLFLLAPGYRQPLAVSLQGKYSFAKNRGGEFVVWDVKNTREVLAGRVELSHYQSVAFSSNEEVLAIASSINLITLWENLSGSPTSRELHLPEVETLYAFGLSPDGRYLSVTSRDTKLSTTVKVFNVATLEQARALGGEPNRNVNVALGANGKILASILDENAVLAEDIVTGKSLKLPHSSNVIALNLSRDGMHALTSTSDGVIQLWATDSGKLIATEKSNTRFRAVWFSVDGKTALALSDNWLHLFSITEKGLEYYDGRQIRVGGLPRLLDETGVNLRMVLQGATSSLEVEDFSFMPGSASEIPAGSARDLLNSWTKKFSQKFDDDRGQLSSSEAE